MRFLKFSIATTIALIATLPALVAPAASTAQMAMAGSARVSASAQQFADHVTMWQGVYSGMTKAEFKAVYPTHRGEISPGCRIGIWGRFSQGKLISLILEDRSDNTACFPKEKQRLVDKFGLGDYRIKERDGGFAAAGFVNLSRSFYPITTWINGPMTIRYIQGAKLSTIYYTIRTDGKFF